MKRHCWSAATAVLTLAPLAGTTCAQQAPSQLEIRGDEIPAPLTREPGSAARGREAALSRTLGNCLLCHALPDSGQQFMGDLGPPLAGVGSRLTPGQLRLRLADSSRLNPRTIMPPYYRAAGLNDVAAEFRGKTILSAQQIEDLVVYLSTLKER